MLLNVNGLCKSFKHVKVLKDISFGLEAGEIVALLGQSGAGKTTIMRCLMGLEKADKGTVVIDDMILCEEKDGRMHYAGKKQLFEIRKHLGMVFQNYHLFPHMSVVENITLALVHVYGMGKEEAAARSMDMLKSIGLQEKADNYPFELSGGQKQRVAIARSCVTNPKFLCFDEPTAALDKALIQDMTAIIKGLAAKGMGILIISHDEHFVEQVSDRTIRIANGVVV